jgi:hypothetical protein
VIGVAGPARRLVLGGLLVAAAGAAACNSENGTGVLMGTLNIPACSFSNGKAQPLGNGSNYNAEWHYFLAEPFDSTTPRFPANQINIRMQNISGGWEFADTLFFWVEDSYAVARCMRGRMNADGTPDWDPNTCDRSPSSLGPSGEGRSLVGTERELVTSHLVLQYTCPDADLTSDALGDCAGGTCPDVSICPGRGSWIAMSHFGAPPANLAEALPTDFKVGNGEPIEASAFHVELCDASTVEDQQAGIVPVTPPDIVGTLDGSFSFKLQPNFR